MPRTDKRSRLLRYVTGIILILLIMIGYGVVIISERAGTTDVATTTAPVTGDTIKTQKPQLQQSVTNVIRTDPHGTGTDFREPRGSAQDRRQYSQNNGLSPTLQSEIKKPDRSDSDPESARMEKNQTHILASIISDLSSDSLSSAEKFEKERMLITQIQEQPDNVDYLIERLPDTESPKERELISSLIAMGHNHRSETQLLKAVAFGDSEDTANWREILKTGGVSSSEDRQRILDNLYAANDEKVMESSILALQPPLGGEPDNTYTLDQVSAYMTSSNSTSVRKAVVRVVGRWGDAKYASVIEQALVDESEAVRAEARVAASASGIRTSTIQMALFEIVRDDTKVPAERLEAMSGLNQYPLSTYEKQELSQLRMELLVTRSGVPNSG